MAEALLEVRRLARRFAAVDALKDVNLAVESGDNLLDQCIRVRRAQGRASVAHTDIASQQRVLRTLRQFQ